MSLSSSRNTYASYRDRIKPSNSESSGALGLVLRAVRAYANLLKLRPMLTKSVTSAIIAALGNLASQILLRVRT